MPKLFSQLEINSFGICVEIHARFRPPFWIASLKNMFSTQFFCLVMTFGIKRLCGTHAHQYINKVLSIVPPTIPEMWTKHRTLLKTTYDPKTMFQSAFKNPEQFKSLGGGVELVMAGIKMSITFISYPSI